MSFGSITVWIDAFALRRILFLGLGNDHGERLSADQAVHIGQVEDSASGVGGSGRVDEQVAGLEAEASADLALQEAESVVAAR